MQTFFSCYCVVQLTYAYPLRNRVLKKDVAVRIDSRTKTRRLLIADGRTVADLNIGAFYIRIGYYHITFHTRLLKNAYIRVRYE